MLRLGPRDVRVLVEGPVVPVDVVRRLVHLVHAALLPDRPQTQHCGDDVEDQQQTQSLSLINV